MKIKDIALSAAAIGERVVKAICVGAVEVWSAVKYIVFKDKAVEQICAENWGDGVGISEEQAAAVTSIGDIFRGNTEITYFDELAEFTGVKELAAYAFERCSNLRTIDLSNINKIGIFGCAYNPLLVSVGDVSKLEIIDSAAFYQCTGLKSVNLKAVTTMNNSFYGCTSLESVGDLSNVIQLKQTFNYCTNLTSVNLQAITELNAFDDCANLKSVGDVSNVTEVGGFVRCTSLQSLNLEAVVTIKDYTFQSCSALEYVGDLSKVLTIGYASFVVCTSLKSINLKAITAIGNRAFDGCTSLSTFICEAVTPPTLGENALRGTTMPIYVPDQSVQAYREASGWSAYADRIMPLSIYVEPTNE